MSEDILFTVAETAEYLKVSKVTVYKMIKNRELEAINIGKRGIILIFNQHIDKKSGNMIYGPVRVSLLIKKSTVSVILKKLKMDRRLY